MNIPMPEEPPHDRLLQAREPGSDGFTVEWWWKDGRGWYSPYGYDGEQVWEWARIVWYVIDSESTLTAHPRPGDLP